MTDFFSIKHSFKAGDFLSLMPGLQHIHKTKGRKWKAYQRIGMPEYLNEDTKQYTADMVCMDERLFLMLKSLIEAQEYIESFEIWKGQKVDIDVDLSRESNLIPFPAGMLHSYPWSIAPELACDLSIPWLKVNPIAYCKTTNGEMDLAHTMVVNRTSRYINPYITYHFLNKYRGHIVFSGTEAEQKAFSEEWNLSIPLIIVDNFLELARIISSCKLFLGNASAAWHIADAQKTNRVIELSRQFPNTFPTGANGYGFYSQRALEFYVNKLMR